MFLFCVLIFFFVISDVDNIYAKYDAEVCDIKFQKCKADCDNFYKIAKKDVYGRGRTESEVNKKKKVICKNKCERLLNICNEKQKKL